MRRSRSPIPPPAAPAWPTAPTAPTAPAPGISAVPTAEASPSSEPRPPATEPSAALPPASAVVRISRSDGEALLREARRLLTPGLPSAARRRWLGGLSLGGLSLLTGCDIQATGGAEQALMRISRFNDRVQAWLFDPGRLAPTYRPDQITRPFPFNAFYPEDKAPVVDPGSYRLEVGGEVAQRRPWTLERLRTLPQTEQITRHICVEGWSAIGRWGGVPFATFLRACEADLSVPYVDFRCADGYHTSIDMPTALHPQTLLTLDYDGEVLPRRYGFPLKLRMPTKLGYKNPKHIVAIRVTRVHPGGYWEDQGYNWFGGS